MLCNSLGASSTRCTCTSSSILPWAISLQPSLKASGSNNRPISLIFTNNEGISVQSSGAVQDMSRKRGRQMLHYERQNNQAAVIELLPYSEQIEAASKWQDL